MHVNQQVREAVKKRLDEIAAFPPLSVFTNRTANLRDADLPAVVINTTSDEVSLETKDEPPEERRVIDLTVVIVADGDVETLDDDLDDLRARVEQALADDLGGLAFHMEHTGAELDMGADEDGHRWYAFLALSWTVEVWTLKGQPEEVLR